MKISSPCHESYQAMSPSSGGRFCASCEKVVIDFTQMSTEEVKNYFQASISQEVCGRFKSPQVGEGSKLEKFIWNLKERIQSSISFVPVRIALVGLLTGLSAFMTSCMGKVAENYPNEEPKTGNSKTENINTEQKLDTIKKTPKQ